MDNPTGLTWEHGESGSRAYCTKTIVTKYAPKYPHKSYLALFGTVHRDATAQWVAASVDFNDMVYVPSLEAGVLHVEALWVLKQ